MKIIGLTGPKGSGKTTAAEYLARTYGARIFAFADPIKAVLKATFDIPDKYLSGTQADKEAIIPGYPFSGRWLMQHFGTDGVRRVLGPDFWANLTLDKIQDEVMSGIDHDLVVIHDVRFLNEAACIKAAGGSIWQLYAPWLTSEDGHQSETEFQHIRSDWALVPETKDVQLLHFVLDRACAWFDIKPVLNSIEAP